MHVILVEDDALARDSYAAILGDACPGAHIRECSSLDEARQPIRQGLSVAMVVIDHGILAGGKALFPDLRAAWPNVPLVVTQAPNDTFECLSWLDLGVAGYLPRTMSRAAIVLAIGLVLTGERYVPRVAVENWGALSSARRIDADIRADAIVSRLTPRQLDVLAMLVDGASNKVIARFLGIHEVTVKSHLSSIYRLLGVTSRTQATREAVLAGLVRSAAMSEVRPM
ncbi:MAG: LuxR C-terminal-related transcriptional regulator [Actinomycetota bacterium]